MEVQLMLKKLQRLEHNIAQLRRFRARYSPQGVMDDTHLIWALRYGLLEAIQIVIDVSCHLVTRKDLGAPQTYAECVALLREHGYLSPTLATKVRAMVGLRNILVHEYVRVDVTQLFGLLDDVGDLEDFIDAMARYFTGATGAGTDEGTTG
jgi:uncharacterized protein YutE (UPF0331/DUF86 family)